jgi:hypothetical protein
VLRQSCELPLHKERSFLSSFTIFEELGMSSSAEIVVERRKLLRASECRQNITNDQCRLLLRRQPRRETEAMRRGFTNRRFLDPHRIEILLVIFVLGCAVAFALVYIQNWSR